MNSCHMMAASLSQTSIEITHTHTQAVLRVTLWSYFINHILKVENCEMIFDSKFVNKLQLVQLLWRDTSGQ
jgi:hypothetical protein